MGDLDATAWTAVAGWVTAVTAMVTTFFFYSQGKHAKAELQDKRIDEKVKGVIGENILLINALTDQAKTAVDQAKAGAAEVSQIQKTVEQVGHQAEQLEQELRTQSQAADQGRAQLEEGLNAARVLSQQLDFAAKRADEDARVVSEARREVEKTQKLLQDARDILGQSGYTTETPAGSFIDMIAVPTDNDTLLKHLLIDVKLIGNTQNLSRIFNRGKSILETLRSEDHPFLKDRAFVSIVVCEREPTPQELSLIESHGPDVHLVPIQRLRHFVQSLNSFG